METSKQAVFQVSLKVLLRKDEKVLITTSSDGDLDLPGGRVDVGEEGIPLEDIITREVREELGENVEFSLGSILFVNRLVRNGGEQWVFHIIFDAEYISGDIKLSDEHINYKWVDRGSYEVSREDFLPGDQDKYEAFKKYFDSLRTV
tara:strand:+ start:169 stop:609 length:441 start_codon:yes stop_codon:yes gene_type:complete